MRIRTIKPEFWQSETLATVSECTLLLAIGLLNHADDEGYFKANERLILASIFPLREPSLSIHCMISELSHIHYITIFDGGDGLRYGQVVNFSNHQRVNRATPSKIRGIIELTESSVNAHCQLTVGREGKGREQGTGKGEEALSQEKESGNENHFATKNELSGNPRELPDENKPIASGNDPFANQFDEHETTMRKLRAVGCKGFVQNREHWIGLVAEHGIDLVLAAAKKTDASNRWSSDVERTIQAKQDGAGHLSDLTEDDDCPI